MSKMTDERNVIVAALETAKLATIMFNKDDVPKSLPAAIITMDRESGKNGTSRQYVTTDLAWTVYLVVNAQGVTDPDSELYNLKELFRAAYISGMGRDIPETEYYTGRIDGARLVRIAKLSLLRSGKGAGS
jgi:hypothetical protein